MTRERKVKKILSMLLVAVCISLMIPYGITLDEHEERSKRMDLALWAADAGVWHWDIPSGVLEWDDRMLSIYGISRENWSGDYHGWVSTLHPDDVARMLELVTHCLENRARYAASFRVIGEDGQVREIQAFGAASSDGRIMSGLCHGVGRQTDWLEESRN